MFGAEYLIAYMAVATKLGFIIVTAIPFWISWNCIAPKYLAQYLPEIFHQLPYWHIVAMMIVIWVISEQIARITAVVPKLINVNINNSTGG